MGREHIVQCRTHGEKPWQGHVVCGACLAPDMCRVYATDTAIIDTVPSVPFGSVCACGADLTISALPACATCARMVVKAAKERPDA